MTLLEPKPSLGLDLHWLTNPLPELSDLTLLKNVQATQVGWSCSP